MKSKPTTIVKKRLPPSSLPSGAQKWKPHNYQKKAIQFLLEHGAAGLFLDPGLGKTSITLAACKVLKSVDMFLGALVVAPLRVAVSTWGSELQKWSDFAGLSMGILHEETAKKSMERVLQEDHDIYVINYEGLSKLFARRRVGKVWKYELTPLGKLLMTKVDTLVWDELSKMKNSATLRYTLIKPHIKKFARRWGLTGSPASNGLEDLFGQCYVLDEGRTLGQFVTHYRAAYFNEVGPYVYVLKIGAEEQIYERLRPLVLRMDAEDYLTLPKELNHTIKLDLPPKVRKQYEELETEFLTIIEDEIITAPNAATAKNKCRQLCAGAVYAPDIDPVTGVPRNGRGGPRPWALLHDLKIDALRDLVDELQGQQLFVAYEFKHDLERLLKAFPGTPFIGGGVNTKRGKEIEDAWNAGEVRLLFGQPASVGYGLNLQGADGGAGHVAHFTPTWDFELYDQFNRRVRRQGNSSSHLHIYQIVIRDSVEDSVVYALKRKFKTQKALLDALKMKKRTD